MQVRYRKLLTPIELAFMKENIPYNIVHTSNFFDREEVCLGLRTYI